MISRLKKPENDFPGSGSFWNNFIEQSDALTPTGIVDFCVRCGRICVNRLPLQGILELLESEPPSDVGQKQKETSDSPSKTFSSSHNCPQDDRAGDPGQIMGNFLRNLRECFCGACFFPEIVLMVRGMKQARDGSLAD